ncbi:hypothetical protein CEUSTIGMA_g620.t1 [Chlamydomonas eustigma]|uniref:Photosystem I reaction center subunit N, chloroplastic n=1 Tax=Chlamydomonas eustigma TaxID=1157962 RepID=A0A250WQQ3_9CHLO|nr:hypothetical protein CEUSTIGMA_g620.t1 [Chlamydomonas eustigma]|eukprot:GAX73167.1 hypothetical protein CEUSTIGMA_g620.t1 [Chlamydomonas eustigma]
MAFSVCNKSVSRCQAQSQPSRRCSVVAHSQGRRELMGLGALIALATVPAAKASLTEDLLAKSSANKALNDKKRLATSYANLARSRTVADGTCTVFTNNFFGCEELAPKPVKYIADDNKLECEGKDKGKCTSRMTGFSP